jgi:hypothetical protein
MSRGKVLVIAITLCIMTLAFSAQDWMARDRSGLPYSRKNPVVYDNDEAVDMYTDEYLMALASLGDIQLKGVLTSSPVAPYDSYVSVENYERDVSDRERLVANARASGFKNVPYPVRGPMGNLQKPISGKIEDTHTIGSAGSWMIVAEAKKASPQEPLVIVSGAPLTAEADAYLLDPSISDKIVIAWLGGRKQDMCDYNGWADPWAAYIVLTKLRLVQFPLGMAPPLVPKEKLLELPASPLRDYMYHKHHPTNSDPGRVDGDGPPAISLLRRDYPLVIRRVSFKDWVPCQLFPGASSSDRHPVPAFYSTPAGTARVVEESSKSVSTDEWWNVIRKALTH